MPDRIQRAPAGLLDVLNLAGGKTPTLLLDEVRGTVDLLQFYANINPVAIVATNAALASGGTLNMGVPTTPGRQTWLIRGACAQVTKTATMTRCRVSIFVRSAGVSVEEMSFITATTGLCTMAPWTAPYPTILQSGDSVVLSLDLLAGDATADVRLRVVYGLVG